MPVFDNVDKVIVVPGESADGCGSVIAGLFGFLIWVVIIGAMIESCSHRPSAPTPSRTESQKQKQSAPLQKPSAPKVTFIPLGPRTRPTASPSPVFLGRTREGALVFGWAQRRWFLHPPPRNPYRYLCVVNRRLDWCWQNPPRPDMRPCTRKSDGVRGWCSP